MGDSPHFGVGNSYFLMSLNPINRQAMKGWCLIFPKLWVDNAYLDGVFHQGYQVMDAQFIHHIATVFFHGLRAHAENVGDLAGGIPFDH